MNIDIIQAITIAVALLGAVLGILNTWHNLKKDKVKLRVYPSNAYKFSQTYSGEVNDEEGVSIDVTNLSFIPITITEIGFANFYLFTGKLKGKKSIPLNIESLVGITLPHRIEPRDSVSFFLNKFYF